MHFVSVLLTLTVLALARSQNSPKINSEMTSTIPNPNLGDSAKPLPSIVLPKQSTPTNTGLNSSSQPQLLNSINPQTSPTVLSDPLSPAPKVPLPDNSSQPAKGAQSQEPGLNGVENTQPLIFVATLDYSVPAVATQQPQQPSAAASTQDPVPRPSQGAGNTPPASAALPGASTPVTTPGKPVPAASPDPSSSVATLVSAVVTKQSSNALLPTASPGSDHRTSVDQSPQPSAAVNTLAPVQRSSQGGINTQVPFTGAGQPSSLPQTNRQSTIGGILKSTSGPVVPPPETRTHVQIIFANRYNDTFVPGLNTTAYSADVRTAVAAAANVESNRISNMRFALQPDSKSVVLIFTLEPFPNDSCWWLTDCGNTIQRAVKTLRKLVEEANIRLTGLNSTALYVPSDKRNSNYVTFQSWTDDGLCPIRRCNQNKVCDCKLTGELYCRGPDLLYLLLLLLLIPIIILIVLAVLFYHRKRKAQKAIEESKKNEKRVVRADMLSYHEYVTKDAELQQPKVATIASRSTISESSVNTLVRSLGENLTIAYNGTSFVDAAGQENSDSTSRDGILPK